MLIVPMSASAACNFVDTVFLKNLDKIIIHSLPVYVFEFAIITGCII